MDNFLDTVIQGHCVDVMNAMPENSTDLVFSDPPYFLQLPKDCLFRPNQTAVDGCTDDWDKFSSFAECDRFTREWLIAAKRILKPNGVLWVMGAYSNIFRVGSILQDLDYWILNDIIWEKSNPLPNMHGTRFCNAHETLIWAVKDKNVKNYTFHYKEYKAGNEDKQMRSDWEFPICSGGERIKDENGDKAHSTQKPEALLHRIIATTTNPGDVVFDPFLGSGTSAAVAKKLGRHYYGCDLEQNYVDIAQKRLDSICAVTQEKPGDLIGQRAKKLPFVNLIELGYLEINSELRLIHEKDYYYAKIQENGTIIDQRYNKQGSIHQVGKSILNTPSCNGWTTWEYYDTDLKDWKLIDNLRSLALKTQVTGHAVV